MERDDYYLPETDREVMEVLWDSEANLQAHEITAEVNRRRSSIGSQTLSFSTVNSVIRRLKARGRIRRRKGEGRSVLYATASDRQHFGMGAIMHLSKTYLRIDLGALLPRLGPSEHGEDAEVLEQLAIIRNLSRENCDP